MSFPAITSCSDKKKKISAANKINGNLASVSAPSARLNLLLYNNSYMAINIMYAYSP